MAAIQSLGVGSGLLTSDLVDKIVASERNATDARMDAKKAEIDAKVSAFGAVKNSIDALRSTAKALGDAATLLVNTATSSDTAIAAAATNKAGPGVHTVEVDALARAHTIASKHFDDITSIVGTGTLAFSFGTTTFTAQGDYDSFTENPQRSAASIVIDDSHATLAGVRDAINAAAIGVTANIVNDGAGYRLVIRANDLGAANSMQITATEGATAGLSALAFNAGASAPDTNMTQTIAAQDARVSIDGLAITRDTNSISGVVDGVTFDLRAVNAGEPAIVTVQQDASAIADKMSSFVDAFNDVRALTNQLTAFDATDNKGSLLTGDPTVRGIRNQLQRLLLNAVSGLSSASVKSLVDVGVTSDQNNQYFLVLDRAKLSAALAKDPTGVQGLLATQSAASDSLVDVVGFSSRTAAGTYAVDVSRSATHGSVVGASLGGAFAPITIDATNDALGVSIDGIGSGSIALTHGTYATPAAFAAELQNRINLDSALKTAGVSAIVTYDATDNHFEISSARYGSASSVGITSVAAGTLAAFGFDVTAARTGLDVAGTINGLPANGNGQFLSVPSGPQPATSGFVRGASIGGFATPLTVDGTNDSFAVRVDGIASNAIVLTDGAYASGDALATEIQNQINADAALVAAGASVAVAYDAVEQRFTITSTSVGANSSVAFATVGSAVTATLGFGVGAGTGGRDAATAADSAAGLSLQIAGDTLGDRGSVTLVRGVMNRIDLALADAMSSSGVFASKQTGFDAQLQKLADEKDAFDKRMTALQTRLQTQFAAADALISKLNSTSSYLSQQLAALPLANTKDKSS